MALCHSPPALEPQASPGTVGLAGVGAEERQRPRKPQGMGLMLCLLTGLASTHFTSPHHRSTCLRTAKRRQSGWASSQGMAAGWVIGSGTHSPNLPMWSGPHASDSLVVAKTALRSQYCPSKSPWPPRPRKSQSALIN